MKLPRRNFLQLAASAVALPAASRIARGQAYPARDRGLRSRRRIRHHRTCDVIGISSKVGVR
jgi:hypothetical protein